MSNEKNDFLFIGYMGDEILPRYVGIVVNHDIRIPFLNKQYNCHMSDFLQKPRLRLVHISSRLVLAGVCSE